MSVDASAMIHPSAIVEDGAVIGANCRVEAFAVIGPKVRLGEGCWIKPHAVITGDTEIGADSTVFSFAVVGEIPQDLKFGGEDTKLRIGARARIREHATLNTGTTGGGGVTRIGDDCLLMAGTHIAHDCFVGDRVVLVNNAGLAGHCVVGDDVIIGGLSGVHQFVRIGRGAIIGGLTKVAHDVLPFGLVQGESGVLDGLNLVGLKRRGVPREEINALREAYRRLGEGEGSFQQRAAALGETSKSTYVDEIVRFIGATSDRSFLTPR